MRQEPAGFIWELLTEDLTIVAKGYEVDAVKARAAAMLVALREMQSRNENGAAST